MSEPRTDAGKALLLALDERYGVNSIPMHIGQPRRTRSIVHDAVARRLPAIEAEAAALERERLRRLWADWSPPCSCGLVQMYGDQLPWGVDHAPKCEATSCDPLVGALLDESTP